MKYFCTLSDYNYLNQGLVLYESIQKHIDEFTLYYLCIDKISYDKLIQLNLDSIIPMYVDDYQEFKKECELYNEYCWSLASRLLLYLVCNKNIKDILYVDSDICFYNDINIIYDEIGENSIGIVPHRLGHNRESSVGKYNVGIIYFKNNICGKKCLNLWVNCVIDLNNKYKKQYGTHGDQKYLELFPIKFPLETCIIQNKVSYGAPWNFYIYDYNGFKEGNRIVKYKEKEYPFIFIHFSQFVCDYENNCYDLKSYDKESFLTIKAVKKIYNEYYILNKNIYKKYIL